MFISIIIPTLNEENYTGALLEFLSTHPEKDRFEVIVVDGGSNDATVEKVSEHSCKLIVTSIQSRAHQMNAGASAANGEVLYFVHADTKLLPSFVDDIQEAINQGVMSGCYRFKFDAPRNPLLHVNGFFTRFPFMWCRGGDQTLFINNFDFEKIGGFDERFVIMEDYDLLERIQAQGISFKVIPKSVKVSARKYNRNSYMKVQLTNLQAMKMYKRRIDPAVIKEYYLNSLD
ncbi:TIGR04283 family arsenosugar biosynthesis glycosyltransferase [Ekhidna sp.]|uniref:TIGR04283 family arsenosugar biosynthesis glycosyltransferase n=1 Tax=Ekhidna sp. TaxID=2608089 RepID=UPI003514FCAD